MYGTRGWFGVFIHSSYNGGDAHYRFADAESLHTREATADRRIAADPTGRLVVRFVNESNHA